jgi:hypothetical protein
VELIGMMHQVRKGLALPLDFLTAIMRHCASKLLHNQKSTHNHRVTDCPHCLTEHIMGCKYKFSCRWYKSLSCVVCDTALRCSQTLGYRC